MEHTLFHRLTRYVIVGLFVALFQMSALYVFYQLFGVSYLLSTSLAFMLTVSVSFFAQRKFTFSTHHRTIATPHSLGLMYCNAMLGLVINGIVMVTCVEHLAIGTYYSQVISFVVLALYNFIVFHFILK